jgi:hypothetical protein
MERHWQAMARVQRKQCLELDWMTVDRTQPEMLR